MSETPKITHIPPQTISAVGDVLLKAAKLEGELGDAARAALSQIRSLGSEKNRPDVEKLQAWLDRFAGQPLPDVPDSTEIMRVLATHYNSRDKVVALLEAAGKGDMSYRVPNNDRPVRLWMALYMKEQLGVPFGFEALVNEAIQNL